MDAAEEAVGWAETESERHLHPEISPEVVTSHARWTPGRPSPRNDLNSDNDVT